MELNKKQIDTTLKALSIAKAVTENEYNKQLMAAKLGLTDPGSGFPGGIPALSVQVSLIDQIEEYDRMIEDFGKLASREDYKTKEE